MIESIAVTNFRCFENQELHGLKRINVIVGRNASGKTALLESIFLAAGASPELVLRFRLWRGLGPVVQISVDRRSYESLWKDLFFSLDETRPVSIQLVGGGANTRSLTIAYSNRASLTLPLGTQAVDSSAIVPIVFTWTDSSGRTSSVEASISDKGLNIFSAGETMPALFFTSLMAKGPAEDAARFSELSKQHKEEQVVEVLRQEFPEIQGLSIEVSGSVSMLYASVASPPEKIPLGMVSGGVSKLVSLLLGIASNPRGIVLVDEIENGFFYDHMPKIWAALLRFCRQYDVQVFASTHSHECLSSLLPVLQSNGKDFCLIRTEREERQCKARVFDARQLESAISHEIEVR